MKIIQNRHQQWRTEPVHHACYPLLKELVYFVAQTSVAGIKIVQPYLIQPFLIRCPAFCSGIGDVLWPFSQLFIHLRLNLRNPPLVRNQRLGGAQQYVFRVHRRHILPVPLPD
ncbi:hypothetical protein D3C85_992710 [compost metagenome]